MPDTPMGMRLAYADKWNCDDALASLKMTYDAIAAKEHQRSRVGQEMSATKKVMDDMQLTATLSVEGRNVEERKARLVEYLQKDADYQAVGKHYDALQDQSGTLMSEISSLGRQVRYFEYRIDYNLAMIRLIGGSM